MYYTFTLWAYILVCTVGKNKQIVYRVIHVTKKVQWKMLLDSDHDESCLIMRNCLFV